MRYRKTLLILFATLAVVQVYAPISMILMRERILREGEPFRFQTAPVDPFDPFQGRYVWLGYEEETAPIDSGEEWSWDYGEKGFARVGTNSDGFAIFTIVTRDRPEEGPYLKVDIRGPAENDEVRLSIPFDRYYMQETLAPEAELAYREHTFREKSDAYAVIRILDGEGVLESLYVAGRPIEEVIKNPPQEVNAPLIAP